VNPEAVPIRVVPDISALRVALGFTTGGAEASSKVPIKSGKFGTGGMQTKLVAAQLATAAGVTTVICHNSDVEHVHAIMEVRARTALGVWVCGCVGVWVCGCAGVCVGLGVRGGGFTGVGGCATPAAPPPLTRRGGSVQWLVCQ
jgi:hypothetical protein